METNIFAVLASYKRLFILSIACVMLAACSPEEPSKTTAQKIPKTIQTNKGNTISFQFEKYDKQPEPCLPGQVIINSGYMDFPGLQCSEVAAKVGKDLISLRRYTNGCKRKTGAKKIPSAVASVQVDKCSQMPKQGNGSSASMLVCCPIPEPEIRPEIIAYNTKLNCPENHVQSLATNLHFPNKNCAEAVIRAESNITSSHYTRACTAAASRYTQKRQRVLDVAVFSCREDKGAYIDVSVCCSAQLPKGKTMHPLEVPNDIWEVIRTNDVFALQLLLSREPWRAKERGERGVTPLHRANSLAAINILLSRRADRNAKDKSGFSPLQAAVQRGQHDIVTRLLRVGAKVDGALAFAKTLKMSELLLANKAKVNGVNISNIPLHSAVYKGRIEIAKLLIKHGADINRVDVNGETPLHRAAYRQHINIVRLLIKHGANINLKTTQLPTRTALDMTRNTEIRALITENGGVSGK